MNIKKSLAFKFAFFSVLAVILPALTIAASLMIIGRKTLTTSLYREQSETVERISDRITFHIKNLKSVISIAANEPGISEFSSLQKSESLKRLMRLQSSIKEAILLDENGNEVSKVTRDGKNLIENINLLIRKSKPEYSISRTTGKTIVGSPFFLGDQLPYLFISATNLRRDSVLLARVDLSNLWDMVKEVRVDEPGIAYIVDHEGYLIAHPDSLRVQMYTNLSNIPIVKMFLEGKTGRESFGPHPDERGDEVVAIAKAVPTLGWGVVIETPTDAAYAPIKAMQNEVIRWTSICVVMILGVALWRVRRIVQPIRMLEEGARKISQGKLNLKLDIETGDELEKLATSFQSMATSLKQLEDLRRDLISMVVHDLKSPLSSVMGGIDYLLESGVVQRSPSGKRVLKIVKKSSEDLLQLIQNLLDVAAMEEGKLKLKLEPVFPYQVLEECIENYRMQFEKGSKVVEKLYDEHLPEMTMDVGLVRRVINNLISNALRHTVSGGRIIISAELINQVLEIVVQDDGEGIPPEYQERIFEKFVQAERKRVRVRSGTGLGLTFCKMAIELHGGRISVRSNIGKGSAFKFTLPLVREPEKTKEELLEEARN